MDFDLQWLLLGLPVAFALGWLASRFDFRQLKREQRETPKAYFKGLSLLLNEQQDKAIDAFIEAVQQDPDTTDLHFALGNLFRRRGEYERAVRVHEHLIARADLPRGDRDRAQHALAQDFLKAGLLDRAEGAFKALEGTAYDTEARLALLTLFERSRDWRAAIEMAHKLERTGTGSYAQRIAHYWCEIALSADARQQPAEADEALRRALEAAPMSARPLTLLGQRLARQGQHLLALERWNELLAAHPSTFPLVAVDYARSARESSETVLARERLAGLYQRTPSTDLLAALNVLDDDPVSQRSRIEAHVAQQATLSATSALLAFADDRHPLSAHETTRVHDAVAKAAKPLQRYRCAACAFESQLYFWQCPGCLGWDTYPPRRLEEI